MEGRKGSDENFNFDVWAQDSGLNVATIDRLRVEDLTSGQALLSLSPDDIKDLNFTIGQRNALKKGIGVLKDNTSNGKVEPQTTNLESKSGGQPDDSTENVNGENTGMTFGNAGQQTHQSKVSDGDSDEKENLANQDSPKADAVCKVSDLLDAPCKDQHSDNGESEDMVKKPIIDTNFGSEIKYGDTVDTSSSSTIQANEKETIGTKDDNAYEALLTMLKELNLEENHPGKITQQQVLSFLRASSQSGTSFSWPAYIYRFLMFDCQTRDLVAQYNHSATGDPLHPQDILLSLFKCCDLHLKQVLVQRLFLCQLAIPFVDPVNEQENMQCTIWPLRCIATEYIDQENDSIETSILKTRMLLVGGCRLGCTESVSKSFIMNALLGVQSHPVFFHKGCDGGMEDRQISNGVIECSWYLPTGRQGDIYEHCMMFLNLRGDCMDYPEQSKLVSKVTDIVILSVDIAELNSKEVINTIRRFVQSTNVILLLSSQQKQPNQNKVDIAISQFKATLNHQNEDAFDIIYTFQLKKQKNVIKIKDEIHEKMLNMLSGKRTKPLENCIKCIKEYCVIDEDDPCCSEGQDLANELIKHLPVAAITSKSEILPLQCELWRNWSSLQKEQSRTVNKGSQQTAMAATEEIRAKMTSIRLQQRKICEHMSPLIEAFVHFLLSSYQNPTFSDLVQYVLSWLKRHIEELSRKTLRPLLHEYQKKWKAFQAAKQEKNPNLSSRKEEMKLAEKNLENSSFKLEHILREIGQIYEANPKSNQYLENKEESKYTKLPMIIAQLLLLGQPLELLDGEAFNIPMTWIKSVFASLEEILGDKQMFVVSVLGIQSSGKSTLLNTMFGLQFEVSAGRCTRGVYLQLINIGEADNGLGFDYILVVDTEGLRAPEVGQQKYDHDNEIATLVIGLGDVTLINIKGENYGEMKDIMQVSVHAFLRMKLSSRNKANKSRCVFVHQNVAAANAAAKMQSGCHKLLASLDEMAVEAAEHENILDIKSFGEIIQFDCDKDVWYFPDLLNGDPPMAHVNNSYTEKARQLKHHILFDIAKKKKTFFRFSEASVHIEGLWKGIMTEDFVFSFKNVLELKAYTQLDNRVREITWSLEFKSHTWMSHTAMPSIGSCNDENKTRIVDTELKQQIADKFIDWAGKDREELLQYFENSDYREIIIQWKENKINTLREHTSNLRDRVFQELTDQRKRQELHILATKASLTHREEITRKAMEVANSLKGTDIGEERGRDEFEAMWDEWKQNLLEKKINKTDPERICLYLQDILYSQFSDLHSTLKHELNISPLTRELNCKRLQDSLGTDDLFNDDSNFGFQPKEGEELNERICQKKALEIINNPLSKIDDILHELGEDDKKFNHVDAKLIVDTLLQTPSFHDDDKYTVNLTRKLQVKLAVHAYRFAYPLFCDMEQRYEQRHGFETMANTYKETTWSLFKNTLAERTDEITASNLICDVLKEKISSTALERIPTQLVDNGMQTLKNKLQLMFNILDTLATKDDYERFQEYADSPKKYALKWVTEYLNSNFFGQSQTYTRYSTLAKSEKNSIMEKLISSMKTVTRDGKINSLNDWLLRFCELAKSTIPINENHLQHVKDIQMADPNNFLKILLENLRTIGNSLDKNFEEITAETMDWGEKNAYEHLLDELWGCEANCPFCGEPCQYSDTSHVRDGMCHVCIQHRPAGVSGRHWLGTNKLDLGVCNYSVKQDFMFSCSAKTCIHHASCGQAWHEYKKYKKHCPSWDIPPGDDMESSKFWLWYMAKYNESIAKRKGLLPGDIPESWKSITVAEAKESLREIYKQLHGSSFTGAE